MNTVTLLAAAIFASVLTGDANADPIPPLAFTPTALKDLRLSPKKVFAHYMTVFPLSIYGCGPANDYYATQYLSPAGENGKYLLNGGYIRERPLPPPGLTLENHRELSVAEDVRRASAIGLDGFACDLLSSKGSNYEQVKRLLTAAQQVDPAFKILLVPDMTAEFKDPGALAGLIQELAKYPSAYRLPDGRLVVAPFNAMNQTAAWWKEWMDGLEKSGVKIAFLPMFQGWQKYAKDYSHISFGMSDWGVRSPRANAGWLDTPRLAHHFAPVWMMPVSPQDARPRSLIYTEARNSENYRTMWKNAIEGKADWVQIVTWNDYAESTEIAPSTGIQWSFYDLTAYYIDFFKTGRAPRIERDVLYYFHRIQPTTAVPDPAKQPVRLRLADGSDPADNEIEILGFLTAPGTLSITSGGKAYTKEVGAGVVSFRAPLNDGKPEFRLIRLNREIIKLQSAFDVSSNVVYEDLLYRGGSSNRPPMVIGP